MRITIEIRRPAWTRSVWLRRSRPLVLLLALVFAGPVLASDRFVDVGPGVHHNDISAIAAVGITQGCNPPTNDMYCPADFVRRDQMGSFLARTAGLGDNPPVTDAALLDGMDSTDFYADGSKVADSELLDGLDSAALQLRVTGTCAAGSAVRVVNAAGTVVCEPDDVDGGNAATVDGKSASDLVRAARMSTGNTTAITFYPTEVTYGTALSITAPSAGFVVVNSSVTIWNQACSVCEAFMRIRHITSGATSNWATEDLAGRSYAGYGNSSVFAVSAGVNTFDIRLTRNALGTGTLSGFYGEMNATFVPFGSTGGSTLGLSDSEAGSVSGPALKEP